jgi:hydrogenase nickel incorporation protein HypA/HybF
MHELSLCKSILEIVLTTATKNNYSKIKSIEIESGILTAIDQSAMRFNFEVLARKTKAENATLHFKCTEAKAVCESCHATVTIKQYYDGCSACGKFGLKIISGEELRVTSMEIE